MTIFLRDGVHFKDGGQQLIRVVDCVAITCAPDVFLHFIETRFLLAELDLRGIVFGF